MAIRNFKALIQCLCSHQRSLIPTIGRRRFSVSASDQYSKRNYANNVSEYNTVVYSLTAQRRHFLLRDVYDDMVLDGVQPTQDIFYSFIIGAMKGSRLNDAFFFRDEMKAMGLVPNVSLFNFLISTCGKCKNSAQAVRLLDEMKRYEVKPNGETYICLLNACAAAGRIEHVYAIVRDMTAAGVGLNKFCYAGLITAHMNKNPMADDVAQKVVELVGQSKGWSPVETPSGNVESMIMGVSEEELYNLPTYEYVHRRGVFINRKLTVYHIGFHACADLKNIEATNTLLKMLEKDGMYPDVFILIQIMRCYLHSGDIDQGYKVFEDYMKSGKPPMIELYVTLVEGAMAGGYTLKGMQLAQDMLVKMNSNGLFLNVKLGSDLLLVAAGEKMGGYSTANYIWDLMQARKITPSFPAMEAYYNGLKEREIPEDDPRLLLVTRAFENLRMKMGPNAIARR